MVNCRNSRERMLRRQGLHDELKHPHHHHRGIDGQGFYSLLNELGTWKYRLDPR